MTSSPEGASRAGVARLFIYVGIEVDVLWLAAYLVERSARAFARDENGQGLVEYALILGLIAIGAMVALSFLAGGVGNVFEMVADNLEAVVTQEDPLVIAVHHGHGWCHHHGGC